MSHKVQNYKMASNDQKNTRSKNKKGRQEQEKPNEIEEVVSQENINPHKIQMQKENEKIHEEYQQENVEKDTQETPIVAEITTDREQPVFDMDVVARILMDSMSKINEKMDDMQGEISHMSSKIKDVKGEINHMSSKIKEDLKDEINHMSNEIRQDVNNMKSEMSEKLGEIYTHMDKNKREIEQNLNSKINEMNEKMKEIIISSGRDIQEIRAEIVSTNANLIKEFAEDIEDIRTNIHCESQNHKKDIENVYREIYDVKEDRKSLTSKLEEELAMKMKEIERKMQCGNRYDGPRINIADTSIKFNGDLRRIHPKVFIKHLKANLKYCYDFEEAKMIIRNFLERDALLWYSSWETKFENWEDFEESFIQYFWGESQQLTFQERLFGGKFRYEGNNNYNQYALEIFNQAQYLEPKIPEENVVLAIAKHFKPEVTEAIVTHNIKKMDQLSTYLKRLERGTRSYANKSFEPRRNSDTWNRNNKNQNFKPYNHRQNNNMRWDSGYNQRSSPPYNKRQTRNEWNESSKRPRRNSFDDNRFNKVNNVKIHRPQERHTRSDTEENDEEMKGRLTDLLRVPEPTNFTISTSEKRM